jgi:hypothetical protein
MHRYSDLTLKELKELAAARSLGLPATAIKE